MVTHISHKSAHAALADAVKVGQWLALRPHRRSRDVASELVLRPTSQVRGLWRRAGVRLDLLPVGAPTVAEKDRTLAPPVIGGYGGQ